MKDLYERVRAEVGAVVVGQDEVLAQLLGALACTGHVLIEGPPGVAKTLLARSVARALGLEFARVQFTPDMLPSDLTGTMVLRGGELEFRAGPVFTNILLADEINRTPPKTQAALLEAMQEGQVSVDGNAHALPDPFLVIATQNPIEYEGTYPLPEAQLDRFMLRVEVGYPSAEQERAMLSLPRQGLSPTALDGVREVVGRDELQAARREIDETAISDDGGGLRRRSGPPHARAPERLARRLAPRRGPPAGRGQGGRAPRRAQRSSLPTTSPGSRRPRSPTG